MNTLASGGFFAIVSSWDGAWGSSPTRSGRPSASGGATGSAEANMIVEELYWKLKTLRDLGHANEKVMVVTSTDDGEEVINWAEGADPEQTVHRGKYVVLYGDGNEL
jgi:hypothetical protein